MRVWFHGDLVPMGLFTPLQSSRGPGLEGCKSACLEGLLDIRRVRRELQDYGVVGNGERNDVKCHVRCTAFENDDVWLSVNLAVADKPSVKIAGKVEVTDHCIRDKPVATY